MDRWTRKGDAPVTHVLLNGGILSVEDPSSFHAFYIDSLLHNKKLYVVEQKTDPFRFFVDLDYKAPEALTGDKLIHICRIMCSVIGQACLVALADPRMVGSMIKTGVHIHWPDLHVTKQEAIQWRSQIILALREEIDYDWASAIDIAVYQGSGLRMLWSYKTEPGSTHYKPWKRISPNVVTDLPTVPAIDLLDLFSIRLHGKHVEVKKKVIQESSDKLEAFIRKNMEGQGEANIHRIIKSDKGDFEVLCALSDSRYCENIHAEHKRNHVWFSIYKKNRQMTIRQKCLDPECGESGHTGQAHILPPSIIEELHKDGLVAEIPSSSLSIYDIFSVPHPSSGTNAEIH
jgi:Herpesviridae UL52/UL70 DNA primase